MARSREDLYATHDDAAYDAVIDCETDDDADNGDVFSGLFTFVADAFYADDSEGVGDEF